MSILLSQVPRAQIECLRACIHEVFPWPCFGRGFREGLTSRRATTYTVVVLTAIA